MNIMDKIKRAFLTYAAIAVASAVVAIVSLILSIVFFKGASYVAMLVFLVLVAIGVYVAVFTLFAAIDRKTMLRFVSLFDENGGDISAVSEKMKWSESSSVDFAERCRSKGYIK